jgi:hypothetical protein
MSLLLSSVGREERARIEGELNASTQLVTLLRRELSRLDIELRVVSVSDFQRLQGGSQVLSDLLDIIDANPR